MCRRILSFPAANPIKDDKAIARNKSSTAIKRTAVNELFTISQYKPFVCFAVFFLSFCSYIILQIPASYERSLFRTMNDGLGHGWVLCGMCSQWPLKLTWANILLFKTSNYQDSDDYLVCTRDGPSKCRSVIEVSVHSRKSAICPPPLPLPGSKAIRMLMR